MIDFMANTDHICPKQILEIEKGAHNQWFSGNIFGARHICLASFWNLYFYMEFGEEIISTTVPVRIL